MTTTGAPVTANLAESGTITPPDLSGLVGDESGKGFLAPGQKDLLAEFEKEQGLTDHTGGAEPEGDQLLAGKFKSVDELAKGYKELEQKLGSRPAEPPAAPPAAEPEGPPAPEAYTKEQGVSEYGEQLANAFEAAEINPYQLWRDAAEGKDTSEQAKAIAEQLGVSESVVANYLATNAKPAEAPAPTAKAAELTEADGAELRALVGGDAEFQQLANWARVNAAGDLPAYQEAVDTANKPAIRAWLMAFQARRAAGMTVEPELEGGGRAPGGDVFTSREEVQEAMRKTNARGQRLYDVDPAYQRAYVAKLARSPAF